MAYIDDWKGIGDSQRDWLSQACGGPLCLHARYMHGSVHRSRPSGGMFLNIDQGSCETCKCREFLEYTPITVDDVLAAHRLLKLDPISFSDFGIEPYKEPEKKPEPTETEENK